MVKRLCFILLFFIQNHAAGRLQTNDLAHCLVKIAVRLEEIDQQGASFRTYMKNNPSAQALDVFEKKFADLFDGDERTRKELSATYQKKDASLKNVVLYVKDILKTMDEKKKKDLLAYVKEYAPALTYAVLYAREIVGKFVEDLLRMKKELLRFKASASKDSRHIDLKAATTRALDARYAVWSTMLARVAEAEWKYAIMLEMFNT